METIEKLRELREVHEEIVEKVGWPHDYSLNVRIVVKAIPTLLDELERLQKALEPIASGEAFREMRFAEDSDADYFLRVQRNVVSRARTALQGAADV